MPFEFVLDRAKFEWYLNNPNGPVGLFLYRRSQFLIAAARRQVGVRTGALRSSIHVMKRARGVRGQYVEVGSKLPYARLHHEGTQPHQITPRNNKVLRFSGRGGVVYTPKVEHPGTKANKYLSDNLNLVFFSPIRRA